jgi:hypothetical protein
MSRFRQYPIGSLYNSVKNSLDKTVQSLKDTYDDISNSINKMIGKKDAL